MRVWLQKQKKKGEAKAAAQAATPVPETTPAATEAPSEVESADRPIDSVEEAPATDDAPAESVATAADTGDGQLRTVSASAQPNEVGFLLSSWGTRTCVYIFRKNRQELLGECELLKLMNTIHVALAGGCSMRISPVLSLIPSRTQLHLRTLWNGARA